MEDKVFLGLNLHNIFTKTMIFLSERVMYLSIIIMGREEKRISILQ
jgi:hypothetical protein